VVVRTFVLAWYAEFINSRRRIVVGAASTTECVIVIKAFAVFAGSVRGQVPRIYVFHCDF